MNTDKHISMNWITFDKSSQMVNMKFGVLNGKEGGGYESTASFTFEQFNELVDLSALKKVLK